MEHFYINTKGENWFDYQHLYAEMVNATGNESHFVEVGTWKGRSACFMAVEILNSGKNIKFDCVDTWKYLNIQTDIPENLFEEDVYEIFLENIKPVESLIGIVRDISWEGANKYTDESLDFVFIDAAHDYNSVVKDINAWLPKVKVGGVLAGHDYGHSGVHGAVKDVLGAGKAIQTGSCWKYTK